MRVLLFNLLHLAADAYFLRRLARSPTPRTALQQGGLLALVSLVMCSASPMLLWRGHYGFVFADLLAWALFGHAPLFLGGVAGLLRRAHPRWSTTCAAALLAILSIAVDAFLIEPERLQITRFRIESPKIHTPVLLALVADIQTDRIGEHERRALHALADARPDLVLFAGDYVQEPDLARYRGVATELNVLLRETRLAPRLGAWAVRGDVESHGEAEWQAIFAGLSVRCVESTQSVDLPDLRLTLLSPGDSRAGDLPLEPSDVFHVVMGHAPDYALGAVQADLLLAGHTHGGQVQLPFIGPLITLSRVPRKWAAGGLTHLSNGRTLIVSRGLGMERNVAPRLRFLCPPEIVLIELVAAERIPDQDSH